LSQACRLFLALWPQPTVRSQLVDLQGQLVELPKVRPTLPENLHITLKFLGMVPQSEHDALREACRRVECEAVELVLDRVGRFPRGGIIWAGMNRVPGPLLELVASLDQALLSAGVGAPRREPWHAHCTLARKAPRTVSLDFEPVVWPVDGFVLVASELAPEGPRYRIREMFPAPAVVA
jgi:RNA 2',3'-cyclic 3'-phosphodiesterase